MRILPGKAALELHPPGWLDPAMGDPAEQAVAALRALWSAHPFILAVTIGFNWPGIAVDVAIPEDGSLDLPALHRDLTERVRASLRRRS